MVPPPEYEFSRRVDDGTSAWQMVRNVATDRNIMF